MTSYICPAWGFDLRPVACRHRALDWLRSKRTRRHLCIGAACSKYQPEWEAKIREEEAERPKCGCGEPLPVGEKVCADCKAWARQQSAHKTSARRTRKEAAQAAIEAPSKGVPMGTEKTERKHKYGDRTIPEGATISSTGRVWKRTMELVPCPSCPTGWMDQKSKACKSCWTPDPVHSAASMAKARAAKKKVEPKPPAIVVRTEKAKAKAEKALAKAVKAGATHWSVGAKLPPSHVDPLAAYDDAFMGAVGRDVEGSIIGHTLPQPASAPDLINHPPHYEAGGFEALPIVRALGFDFEEGSAFKYLFRHKRKGMPLEDLKKCRFFLNSLIERYESEGATP